MHVGAQVRDWKFFELRELAKIYEERGLSPDLAAIVALQLSSRGEEETIRAHIRDDIGIDEDEPPRPLRAAWVSFVSFSLGSVGPIVAAGLTPPGWFAFTTVTVVTLVLLFLFGSLSAQMGGSPVLKSAVRLTVGGLVSLMGTFGVGRVFSLVFGMQGEGGAAGGE
uniref:VIT family protein n=1 Tax=Chromera velia CCMP2878 TaxID=1169474 RepID=A0A0G4GWP3_9ALVE|eukprot:Cvel_23649.t1-p1 / transcript=Cvel_23649.t1 / gene=Cvel_23649 / organism=Chromera_velia_CCMP2878 / gene_product=Fe(2 )/Mn(2 ) transporter pcl1, putative / transcript_product=Fe(2 )/Mn(2 ) transporter pcl1, putative / location=Cvel_scaffold2462:133-1156(+) / protein_length=165 / sequence_SO=supercontig / SO=protein_coding / is_pseudo=false